MLNKIGKPIHTFTGDYKMMNSMKEILNSIIYEQREDPDE
jgi:hypothetical protein